MRKEMPRLEEPLNADERLLYCIGKRLDRIIDLLENIIEEKVEEPKISEVIVEAVKEIKEVKTPKAKTKKEV